MLRLIHQYKLKPYDLFSILFFSLIGIGMLFFTRCTSDEGEVDEFVVPQCIIFDFNGVPSPNSITISPGGSGMVIVTATVVPDVSPPSLTPIDCSDIATGFTTIITGDNPMGFTISGCGSAAMSGNTGTCDLTISAPAGIPDGFYQIELYTTATLNDGRTSVDTKTLYITVTARGYSVDIPTNWGVLQGMDQQVNIDIARTGGHDEEINLSLINAPAGISYLFDPNPVPGSITASQLSLFADISAVPGEYDLTLSGNDGIDEEQKNFTVFVSEPFSVSFQIDTVSILAGQEGELTIDLTKVGYWVEPIILDISSSIIGTGSDKVEALFDPNPSLQTFVSLTLIVGSAVEPGTYELEVTASSMGLDKTGILTLEVID